MTAVLALPIEGYVVPVKTIGEDATLGHARELLDRGKLGCLPVLDARGRAVGVLSRTDLFRVGRDSAPPRPRESKPASAVVSSAMTRGAVVVSPDTSVGEAARTMVDQHIHHLVVEDEGRVIGMFGVGEVMRALVDAEVATPLSAIMTRPVHGVSATATIAEASAKLEELGVSGLAVKQGGSPVGVFTRADAIDAAARPDDHVKNALGWFTVVLPASTPVYAAARRALDQGCLHVLVTGEAASTEGAPMLVGIVTGFDLAGAAILAR